MSWLFAISKSEDSMVQENGLPHGKPIFRLSLPHFYLALGRNPATCLWETVPDNSKGWAVVGVGIQLKDSRATFLTHSVWRNLLTQKRFEPNLLDGHFVVVRWDGDQVECFTDQLGLRTLYYGEEARRKMVCISTRLDWVARVMKRREIDFISFGGRWLFFNQLSYGSGIVGIERLGPGGHVIFRSGSLIQCSHCPWLPPFESYTTDSALQILNSIVDCAFESELTLSLSLSGGIDSRFLLAMLLLRGHETGKQFNVHTFGSPDDPDVLVAKRIALTLGLSHCYFQDSLPEREACIEGLRDFVAETMVTEPCTSWVKRRYYSTLREEGKLVIDGGLGEIARRGYLNRVVRLGRTALRQKNATRLFGLMYSPRASIFSHEVRRKFEEGALISLVQVLEEMPSAKEIGVENFADLLAVRTRVPNYGGFEQSRLDREILNFMPLVQPSFLRVVFGIPPEKRAVFYFRTIQKISPLLVRFPLVKSGLTYPFGFPKILSWSILKIKSLTSKRFSDPAPHQLLQHIREYVLDLLHSQEIKTCSLYSYPQLVELISRYYQGEHQMKKIVDWWLTFELWRQSLEG